MTSIALPVHQVLTPRLEFPAWVRRISAPLKMLSPLGGALTPLGVGGSVQAPLLLDTVTGAVAAYSLRKLRNAYAGSAVRVRRSSDNSEQDIGFSSNNFDAAAFSAFIGAGSGYVATWYDQSGNANNATQATAGSQPQIVLNVQNGRACVRIDGIDDYLALSMPGVAVGLSVLLTVKVASSSSKYLLEGATPNQPALISNWSSKSYEYFTAFDRQTLSAGATGVNLIGFKGNNATVTGRFNGSQVFSITPAVGLVGKSIGLISSSGMSGYFADTDYYELLVYDAVLSDETFQTAESDINAYYVMY